MSQPLILVADDEPKIRRLLSINLASLGYEVICAVDGPSALQVFEDHQPDLVLLDIMMPGLDGYDVLTRIRRTSNCAVILLTAKDQIEDKIRAFDLGADDYLPKPFALEELFGRVRAVLRRLSTTHKVPDQEIVNGSLKLNTSSHQVWFEDKEIKLSAVEFSMLEYFMRHVNSVLVHEQIIAHVWAIANSKTFSICGLRWLDCAKNFGQRVCRTTAALSAIPASVIEWRHYPNKHAATKTHSRCRGFESEMSDQCITALCT